MEDISRGRGGRIGGGIYLNIFSSRISERDNFTLMDALDKAVTAETFRFNNDD